MCHKEKQEIVKECLQEMSNMKAHVIALSVNASTEVIPSQPHDTQAMPWWSFLYGPHMPLVRRKK